VDRRFLRPGWIAGHVLVFLAFLTCLRLGWWQWDRSHDADGTAQNLGYALLWPAFGAAFIYMWIRFLHLEVLKDEQDAEDDERELELMLGSEDSQDGTTVGGSDERVATPEIVDSAGTEETEPAPDDDADQDSRRFRRRPDLQRPSQGVTIAVATVGADDDDDPELTAYNQALAALAEEDRRRAR
jgi:DNA-binding transcriptional regulator of glucitol operon